MSDTNSLTTANGVLAVLLHGTADSDGGGKQANPRGADFQFHTCSRYIYSGLIVGAAFVITYHILPHKM